LKKYFDNTESITNSADTRMSAEGMPQKLIEQKYITALNGWDVDTLSTFKTSGLPHTWFGGVLTFGDIVTTRERVDLLIEWGFISLTDVGFLRLVLQSVGRRDPDGWSASLVDYLFYKMDKKSLGSYRHRVSGYQMSIANALYYAMAPMSVHSVEWMFYLLTECGFTVRSTDCGFLPAVESPSEMLTWCKRGGCDPNKKDLDGLIPFYQYLSTWVDFDKPAWTDSENLPPHVYRDSLGLDIWHMFLAYVSAGMDVSIVDTDGHTMEDYFSHLTVFPGWDGPRHDSGSVLDWYLDWKAKQ
jgi:hypothetical protein